MYNNLVENCFDKCVMTDWYGVSLELLILCAANVLQNFNSKQLAEPESKCLTQCAEKFMKLTQRVGFRFSEFQALKEQASQGK